MPKKSHNAGADENAGGRRDEEEGGKNAKNVNEIAKKLGATIVGKVSDTGGGAFGMARLGKLLAERLQPSQGRRPGRPSDPNWVVQAKVPMSQQTKARLTALAEKLSGEGRRVSPMQVAAQLLEESVVRYSSDG